MKERDRLMKKIIRLTQTIIKNFKQAMNSDMETSLGLNSLRRILRRRLMNMEELK
jgi:hypothetical protein